MSIGRLGPLTPDEARRKAREILGTVASGGDPAAEREKDRAAARVSDLVDAFMTEHVETKRKAATTALYRHSFDSYVVPELGKRKAADLTRADVAKLHHSLRDRPFLANRVISALGSMLSWAGKHGHVPDGFNPTARLEKYAEDRRERFLSVKELERVGAAIRLAETEGIEWTPDASKPKAKHAPKKAESRRVKIDAGAAAALRLLIFTGARLREILHLRWTEVDFERGLLLLPDSKTGRKTVILNAPSLVILHDLKRVGAYVIPSESAGKKDERPRHDLKRPWAAVSKAAGLDGVRLHDLRHTHASFGAGAGLGLPIVGKLLGHTQPSTTARYAHLDNDPLRRASEQIGQALSAALDGSRTRGGP